MSKKHLFLLLMVLGTAFWGISFSFVKNAVSGVSPFVFLTYKFALASLCVGLVFRQQLKRINPDVLKTGFYLSLPLILGNIFQTIGLQHTSVTHSAFITGLDVLLIPIFKALLFRKTVANKIWVACALAALGLYFIVAHGAVLAFNLGDLWTAICAIFFATYVLTVGYHAQKMDTLPTVIVMLFWCALGCLLAGLLSPNSVWLSGSSSFWGGVLFAAIPGTAFMYSVQNLAQKYIEDEKIALTYLCEPVFASIFGVILLKEPLTPASFTGAALILFALFVAEADLPKILQMFSYGDSHKGNDDSRSGSNDHA